MKKYIIIQNPIDVMDKLYNSTSKRVEGVLYVDPITGHTGPGERAGQEGTGQAAAVWERKEELFTQSQRMSDVRGMMDDGGGVMDDGVEAEDDEELSTVNSHSIFEYCFLPKFSYLNIVLYFCGS